MDKNIENTVCYGPLIIQLTQFDILLLPFVADCSDDFEALLCFFESQHSLHRKTSGIGSLHRVTYRNEGGACGGYECNVLCKSVVRMLTYMCVLRFLIRVL